MQSITIGHHVTKVVALAGALAISGLVGAPLAASAEDLPPAPVMPGFEDVVIGARPLGDPAMPAPADIPTMESTRLATPTVAASPTAAPVVKRSVAPRVAKKRAVTKSVRVCTKKAVKVRGKKVTRTVCVTKKVTTRAAVKRTAAKTASR